MDSREGEALVGNDYKDVLLGPTISSPKTKLTVAEQRRIVNIVANALYDVVMYPGHVAIMINGNVERRQFLKKSIAAKEDGKYAFYAKYLVGFLTVSLIPIVGFSVNEPKVCTISDTIKEEFILNDTQAQVLRGAPRLCHLRDDWIHILIVGTAPAYLQPLLNLFLTVLFWFSLNCCGPLGNLIYGWWVRLVITTYSHLLPYMVSVSYIDNMKPVNYNLKKFTTITRRLFKTPYQIIGWFVFMVIFLAMTGAAMSMLSYTCVLLLFVWESFFPAMNYIFGVDFGVIEIIDNELREAKVPMFGATHRASRIAMAGNICQTGGVTNSKQALASLMKIDVWVRMRHNQSRGKIFSLNSLELAMILKYFDECQKGWDYKDESGTFRRLHWPVTWHDDLCITNKTMTEEIYIDDFDLLLSRNPTADLDLKDHSLYLRRPSSGDAASPDDANVQDLMQDFFTKFLAKAEQLQFVAQESVTRKALAP